MKYDIGTVELENGSTTVTGNGGQDFLANLLPGQLFTKIGSGVTYEIASVTDEEHFELVAPYGGADDPAALYTVVQSFTPNFGIPYPEIGDVQTATIVKRALTEIDELLVPLVATTAQLDSVSSQVNVKFKAAGRSVWNSDTHKIVYASGPDPEDEWYDAAGVVAHTPS